MATGAIQRYALDYYSHNDTKSASNSEQTLETISGLTGTYLVFISVQRVSAGTARMYGVVYSGTATDNICIADVGTGQNNGNSAVAIYTLSNGTLRFCAQASDSSIKATYGYVRVQ